MQNALYSGRMWCPDDGLVDSEWRAREFVVLTNKLFLLYNEFVCPRRYDIVGVGIVVLVLR